jgi:tight adherence protein B
MATCALVRRCLASAAAAALVVLGTATAASAADGQIVNIDRSGSGLVVSVDVPADAEVDLAGVTATVGDTAYEATATFLAEGNSRITRTTVLAIDTSKSMEGNRFTAAKAAAEAFLKFAPADVRVGIVSFDSDVTTELEPTTDRARARVVVAGLGLSKQTLLYEGVIKAVNLTGATGQRSVLVISDGADTGRTTDLEDVTAAVEASKGVVVDVVALQKLGDAAAALDTIVGDAGEVTSSDSDDLAARFSAEAEILNRQIAVSIDAPDDITSQQASIAVTLPSDAGDVVARSTMTAVAPATPSNSLETIPQAAAPSTAAGTPGWLIYVGVAIFGVGLLLALVMLAPAKPVQMSAEDRVSTYTAATLGGTGHKVDPDIALTQQASDAIAGVLDRNKGLDERIATRLETAGSELRPSEWLLVHAGLFVVISLVGLLLGRGSIVLGLIFMVGGAVGPWIYLGMRGSKRRKKFNSQLPETLQLMSGSLSAGLSLSQSIDTIVREGSEPMASAFRRVLVETRIGVSLENALDGVADRFDSRDFRWVVMAIKIQRQVGGNLAELLNTVAETMREREYMRRQVAALAAEGKLSAIVLGALPPLFLLYLLLTQGDYVKPLFTDPLGIAMLVGSGAWLAVGVFWMSKLVKVEV